MKCRSSKRRWRVRSSATWSSIRASSGRSAPCASRRSATSTRSFRSRGSSCAAPPDAPYVPYTSWRFLTPPGEREQRTRYQDEDADDHLLQGARHADENQHLVDQRHEHHAEQGTPDRPGSPGDARAAENDRGDHIELGTDQVERIRQPVV